MPKPLPNLVSLYEGDKVTRVVIRNSFDCICSPRDVGGTEERAFSPFNLDSETGTSTAPSPVINDLASEYVVPALSGPFVGPLIFRFRKMQIPFSKPLNSVSTK